MTYNETDLQNQLMTLNELFNESAEIRRVYDAINIYYKKYQFHVHPTFDGYCYFEGWKNNKPLVSSGYKKIPKIEMLKSIMQYIPQNDYKLL